MLQMLDYLHSQGYAHCDLKPANIFVVSDSVVKIGDLGLMQPLIDDHFFIANPIGTVHYMAPSIKRIQRGEMAKIHKNVDFYSLGLLMFRLVTAYHYTLGYIKQDWLELEGLFTVVIGLVQQNWGTAETVNS